MYQPNNISTFKLATVVFMVIRSAQLASAGTQGAYINSYGVGVAVDNVSYFGGSTTAFSSSIPIQNPSAGVPSSGYPLPKATPSSVFCDSQGFANYVWNISCYVTGGATADDPALDVRVHVPPQPCARYDINSTSDV